jgi:hypothetical protein
LNGKHFFGPITREALPMPKDDGSMTDFEKWDLRIKALTVVALFAAGYVGFSQIKN